MRGPRRKLRRSQAVTTFGPGAIVDLRDESVMMVGIHKWPEHSVEIHEPNLQASLRVSEFRMPAVGNSDPANGDLPAIVFPRWMVCPKCNRLAPLEHFAGLFAGAFRIKCPQCKRQVFPARLVVACESGHIADFPWVWWVHQGGTCPDATPSLRWITQGRTASLADILITCDCGAKRTLGGATNPSNFMDLRCTGERPWLLTDPETDCDQKVIPLQRGASNVYFASIRSALSIPPWSNAVHAVLNKHWFTLKSVPDYALQETVDDLMIPQKVGLPTDDVVQAILARKHGDGLPVEGIPELKMRYQEFLALRRGAQGKSELDDFHTRETEVPEELKEYISKVVLVDRLREVRVMRGFGRVSSPDPFDPSDESLAKLSPYDLDWLPGIEVRGEGIYFELGPDPLAAWEQQEEVSKRSGRLNDVYQEMCRRRKWQSKREITARMVLMHSLAHALIRQLSLDAGYASASIRERIYAFMPDQISEGSEGGAGVLLYTSTVDSEGSLGGLVRQGMPDRFAETFLGAIDECAWCSSDPLCIESEGQGPGAMNLAACHACLLISETSCEEFNRLLDRGLLVGTPLNPSTGFFSGLLEG